MGPDSPATVWNVPHRKNLDFSDKRGLVGALRTALASGGTTALTAVNGMGGVGKTQLALAYAYYYTSHYQAVLWVPSEEPAALASAFAGLARELGLQEQAEVEQSIAIEAVRRWLDSNADWLMIFDNAQGPKELDEYLPKRATGHVIITSRNPNWGGVAESLQVEKFQRDESIEFLLTRTGEPDQVAANELAEELGDLPLALEQARAYVERTGGDLSHYLSLYRERFQELWEQDEPPQGYNQTIATTWSMSIEQLPQAAADLLAFCAFLAPDDIPREMIAESTDHLPEPLASIVSDALALDRAVAELRSYSLLAVGGDSWSVHRLVQAVVRGRIDNDERNGWAEAAAEAMRAAFPYDNDDAETWPACSRLLAHALAAAGHSERVGVAAGTTVSMLNQVGLYLYRRARFLEAKSALERAIYIAEMDLGPKDRSVAGLLTNLGVVLRDFGELEGAREHSERALEICEGAYSKDHPDIATASNNLGNVLLGLGDLDGAREHHQRALQIDEANYGPEHPEVAKDLKNMGNVLWELGDLNGAREYSLRALNILEGANDPNNPVIATVSNNLGGILRAMGDLDGARKHIQRALDIDEATYGPDHPEVATDLNSLGSVLRDLGDLDGARERVQRALSIYRDRFGEDHPSTILIQRNLETLLR